MLDRNNPYYRQVELVMRVLPLVAREGCFALKGGTAINLFVRDLPRLSVDIDLAYLPLDSRDVALSAIQDGLRRIAETIERVIYGATVNAVVGEGGCCQKFQVSADGAQIKIEVSPVLRGSVLSAVEMPASDPVADQFGYVETLVIARDELYAGKLIAALDRQHPRDLFDIKILLESEGFSQELVDLFVIYLLGSSRPISELLAPNMIPLQPVFDQQFSGMSLQAVAVAELEQARRQMLEGITAHLTDEHKVFLISFKEGEPEWGRLAYPQAEALPAVRWKLQNVRKLKARKKAEALAKLRAVLFGKND